MTLRVHVDDGKFDIERLANTEFFDPAILYAINLGVED